MSAGCSSGSGPRALGEAVAALFSQHLVDVVNTDPRHGGRKVVSTDRLKRGGRVMRERGLAVPVAPPGGSGSSGASADRERWCGYCFRALKRGERSDACCAGVAEALAEVESGPLADAVAALAQSTQVQETLLRLWLRIIAAANAVHPEVTASASTTAVATADEAAAAAAAASRAAARARLADWAASIRGCAELDTSAPSTDWLVEVMGAADALWGAVLPDVQRRAAELVLPAVAASPAGRGRAASEMTMPEALLVIAGQLNRNGYSVRDVVRPNEHAALGMFPAVAMFNHACSPNCCVVTFPDGHLEVRTLRDVAEGVELTVSYVDLLLPREDRMRELLATKEFVCHCLRCDAPDAFPHERLLSTPTCPRCRRAVPRRLMAGVAASGSSGSGGMGDGDGDGGGGGNDDDGSGLIDVSYQCRTEDGGCGAVLSARDVTALMQPIESALSGTGGSRVAQFEAALRAAQGVLAPEHALHIRARLGLGVLLEQAGGHRDAADHMGASLASMGRHLPEHWPEQAEWWVRLGRVRVAAGDRARAVEAFGKALAAARVCFGLEHPFTALVKGEMEGAVRKDK